MAFIFMLSSIPKLPTFRAPFDVQTLAHVVFFAVLCFLAERALYYQHAYPSLRLNSLWAAFVLTCIYGILDEIHQLYVPGRWADIYDVVADSMGAAIAVAWLRTRFRGFRRPTEKEALPSLTQGD
ncbi:MAG TPA: VanZ family protein [Bacteroidota bacterium]|nr:VanZ family protein [Bacteroidota bacterium]